MTLFNDTENLSSSKSEEQEEEGMGVQYLI